jgi:hypothetical protein
MKRIFSLLKKDIILGIKDIFILLEVGFSIFLVFFLIFIVPEEIDSEAVIYIYDSSDVLQDFVNDINPDSKEEGELFVDSRDAVIEGMTEDKSAVGVIIKENNGKFDVELLTQPYTKEALVKYIEVDIRDILSIITPSQEAYPPDVYHSVTVTSLIEGEEEAISFKKRILPAVLMFMVGIMGLFAMVSLLTQERSELTIRVFRVTPADMWAFITSKYLMVLCTGIVTFSIIYIPMMGFSGYFESLLIMVLTILVGSSIGVILASFFDNVMGSLLWVMLIMIILALPAISLFAPIFTPDWMKILPSYYTLFGLDAAMFPAGNRHIIWQSAGILASIGAVLYILSGLLFNRLVGREV